MKKIPPSAIWRIKYPNMVGQGIISSGAGTGFRITKTKYLESAFSGDGARLTEGRWNRVGSRMVYLGSSLSLATLELFIHIENHATLMRLFNYFQVTIDRKLIKTPKVKDLAKG